MRNDDGTFLCGDNYTVTHNSFFSAPFIMTRSLLIPNHITYVISVSGGQSSATFSKMEDLANNNIASAIGVSSVFLDNVKRPHTKASGFTHGKDGCHVELFNGSEVTSLNSVPEHARGARSNLNVYDEGAFIPKELYTATLPFTAVSADFRTSKGLNAEIYPQQIPNLNMILSSASDTTSEMYAQYREAFRQMLLGNTNYFVCDLDYHISTAPFLNGRPMKPLVSMDEVERMYNTQPYKAEREFANKWSADQGENVLVKRSTIEKNSCSYYPQFSNDTTQKFIISYDPSSRQDNSVILVGELIRDESKGLMLKLSYMKNLVERLANGQAAVIQKPEQVEILKDIMLDFNYGYLDYDGLDSIFIDAGAGGGGFEIGQYLLTDFVGKDKKNHRGIIDKSNEYMAIRADDYPAAAEILHLFNFKRDKTNAYLALESAVNQGLVIFPSSLNVRNELEFEEEREDGSMYIRYEKPSLEEMDSLLQMDLMKEEILGTQKSKKTNGTIVIEQTPEAKSNNLHDDRADVLAMMCFRLMELRANEVLDKETKVEDFSKIFKAKPKKKNNNPFVSKQKNPFIGKNPFS